MRAWWPCLLSIVAACGGGGSDDCPAFVAIADGSFSRTQTTLTWTLEVGELPAELTFDREGVPSFVEEYSWGIDLDADGDGTRDWEVAAKHFKMDVPEQVASPLDVLQVDLWRVDGAAATISGDAGAMIDGNVFTFTVAADQDPDLALVTDPSQSTFSTFHQFGPALTDSCSDHL